MIHRPRYLAAMDLAPNQRPPVALRYAIWTLACAISDEFGHFQDLFYRRARKYLEEDAARGYGEHVVSVAMAQTHVLLTLYEFRMMYFPRAWMSTGAAVRLCQMLALHRIDGAALEVKACAPPPRDWTEREERRRTFWMAFCMDKYASIGTGWPMAIDERDVTTHLPATEQAYNLSRPEQTQSLPDSLTPQGAARLSSFGGIALMACLFGRNLTHLHRPDADDGADGDADLNGAFWRRHRQLDNLLLNTTLCMPQKLRLPEGLSDPNAVWTVMCIHTSTICLHQAAIFKADKHRLPAHISGESKMRCIAAANETASIMRMISHTDMSASNPFVAFSLYVAARVFVQYLKSRPDDSQTSDSLSFLLTAMTALKRRNPFTESFLVQLDVDVESLVARAPELRARFRRSADQETWQRLSDRGKLPNQPNIEPGTRSCNHMSLSDDLPEFSQTTSYPSAGDVPTMLPYDSTGGGGSGIVGETAGGGSAGGHIFHNDAARRAAGTTSPPSTSSRPTPNSNTTSDFCTSLDGGVTAATAAATYTAAPAQLNVHHLSPGSSGRSFNASPASSHHNLGIGDPGGGSGGGSSCTTAATTISSSTSSPSAAAAVAAAQNFFASLPLFSQPPTTTNAAAMHDPHPQISPHNFAADDGTYSWMRDLIAADPTAAAAAEGQGLDDPATAAARLMGMAASLGQHLDMSAWTAMQ
jgi:hypothetical protein